MWLQNPFKELRSKRPKPYTAKFKCFFSTVELPRQEEIVRWPEPGGGRTVK